MNTRSFKRCRGLSLVEVLITISICSTLMAAVAMAFQSTAQAVQINERFFRAQQAARVTVTQVMAEARRCRSGIVDAPSLEIVTATGETRTYNYDPDKRHMTMTIQAGLEPYPVYVLARDVSSAAFSTNGKSILFTITVDVEGNTATLSESALPRKTMEYR